MIQPDPTKRFSDRVDNYVKYRPGYPHEIIDYLKRECGLTENSVVADVGAGTGIFTKMLLQAGYRVYAVEPNLQMRGAAIEQLSGYEKFTPVDGTAEATTLPAHSIDLIVCAQAFHWFNNENTRAEFNRVLKEKGHAALVWNNRLTDADEFLTAYNSLLRNRSVDYNRVNHQNIDNIDFAIFFNDGEYKVARYPNQQVFDEEGLIGRALSSSYVPQEDTGAGQDFLKSLKELFAKYNHDGKVVFRYQTEIYLGEV